MDYNKNHDTTDQDPFKNSETAMSDSYFFQFRRFSCNDIRCLWNCQSLLLASVI